jgi:hypothetical protein
MNITTKNQHVKRISKTQIFPKNDPLLPQERKRIPPDKTDQGTRELGWARIAGR